MTAEAGTGLPVNDRAEPSNRRPAIDAVVIASSTDSHAPLIDRLPREAGKQIFCEKPIALDLETTDAALAAVAGGVRLQIGFQRRFDGAYRKAKELIARGRSAESR